MTGAQEYDYRDIDDVIHGRVRLAVMAYLSGVGAADFNELKPRSAAPTAIYPYTYESLKRPTMWRWKRAFAAVGRIRR